MLTSYYLYNGGFLFVCIQETWDRRGTIDVTEKFATFTIQLNLIECPFEIDFYQAFSKVHVWFEYHLIKYPKLKINHRVMTVANFEGSVSRHVSSSILWSTVGGIECSAVGCLAFSIGGWASLKLITISSNMIQFVNIPKVPISIPHDIWAFTQPLTFCNKMAEVVANGSTFNSNHRIWSSYNGFSTRTV